MHAAGRLGWTAEAAAELAVGMGEELAASGRLREAAALAADYGGGPAAPLAVGRLLQAHAWREALATSYR